MLRNWLNSKVIVPCTLKKAPKLIGVTLNSMHFYEMKVSQAFHAISVSAGITYVVETESSNINNLTTTWFMEMLSKWFHLMLSRSRVMAFSKQIPDMCAESVELLKVVSRMCTTLLVEIQGAWKPFHTGILLSTTSVLELAGDIKSERFNFLLTSRVSEDYLESFFQLHKE
jgi:hypothetical protein